MRNTPIFALAAMSLMPNTAIAQEMALKQATEEIAALIEAENQKSALCKSYEGQQVTVTTFDGLVRGLPKYTPKGEFETTDQYDARLAAAGNSLSAGPFVLILPTNRKYLEYDADIGVLRVKAGAFDEGQYSNDTKANIMATPLEWNESGHTRVAHSENKRRLKTYNAQTRLGVQFVVSKYDLQTNALSVASPKLFSFARDKYSTVMGFELPVAQAPSVKPLLKVALVVEPQSPYLLLKTSENEWTPSLDDPTDNTYRSSIAIVKAKCGLVVDAQFRVLAAMDSGG